MVGFAAPPVAGLTILALVLSGTVSGADEQSAAATSTALIIGALLTLLPPVLYVLKPDEYAEHQTALDERVRRLLEPGD